MFNIGRATQWIFADGLGINPKADPETISLAILILRQVARPSLCRGTPRRIIEREIGGHCTNDRFYMHQAPFAYMVVFDQRRASNHGPSFSGPTLYRPGCHGPLQSMRIRLKICSALIQKQIFHSTTKPTKWNLNMIIGMFIKFSSIIMQGKKKLCEYHTRF